MPVGISRIHSHRAHTSLSLASWSPVVDPTRYLDVIPPVGSVSACFVEICSMLASMRNPAKRRDRSGMSSGKQQAGGPSSRTLAASRSRVGRGLENTWRGPTGRALCVTGRAGVNCYTRSCQTGSRATDGNRSERCGWARAGRRPASPNAPTLLPLPTSTFWAGCRTEHTNTQTAGCR